MRRDRFGRPLTPGRAYTITDPQRRYLAMLIREAFRNGWTYRDVGCLDDNHLEPMSQRDASAAISRLKAAKDRGWRKDGPECSTCGAIHTDVDCFGAEVA